MERWNEIFESISKNKLRTFLTAFSVSWGIFMFVILISAGNGLERGISLEMQDDANNALFVGTDITSIAHDGMNPGRVIQMNNENYDHISSLEDVEYSTARFHQWGAMAKYKNQQSGYSFRAVHPEHKYLENTIITEGRFINDADLIKQRKVAVLGENVVQELCEGENPVGNSIEINGVLFQVVGTFTDEGNDWEKRVIYIPISTGQTVFNGLNKVNRVLITTNASVDRSLEMEDEIVNYLAKSHSFSPDDQRAVEIWNSYESFSQFQSMMGGIRIFLTILSFFTLFAGIVGVSNIMTVVVKERTKEIGVRKALGATPRSIIGIILYEAIFVTSIAGYFGMLIGIVLIEVFKELVGEIPMFHNPGIDLSLAIRTTILLIIAGSIAGLFPAWRAARIKPVVAMREE